MPLANAAGALITPSASGSLSGLAAVPQMLGSATVSELDCTTLGESRSDALRFSGAGTGRTESGITALTAFFPCPTSRTTPRFRGTLLRGEMVRQAMYLRETGASLAAHPQSYARLGVVSADRVAL